MTAKPNPRKPWSSAGELSFKHKLCRNTVLKILTQGNVPSRRGRRGRLRATVYNPNRADAVIVNYVSTRTAAVTGSVREQIMELKRRLLEIEIAERSGLSVPREEINARVAEVAAAVRAILVQRITVELPASILQGLGADGVRAHCVEVVNGALGELMELGELWAPKEVPS